MKKNKLVLNNKGYMLVETIVASVIAFVIAYFLIDITIKMVSKNDDFYLTSVLQTDQSLITKEIMDDFNNYTVTGVTCNSPVGGKCSSATISFKEISSKNLSVSGRTVTYGSYTKTFDDTLEVGELSFYVNNEILYISLPAYTNYSDKNYGLNVSVKYDPTITEIKVPKTKLIEVTDEVLEENKTTTPENVEYPFEYTGDKQEQILKPGTYYLEVWGAQGGSFNTTYIGGKGGYSHGLLTLDEETKVHVYVGGKGTNGTTSGTFVGGFNGGGKAYSNNSTYDMSAGGGASDIRIITDGVTDENSLYSRVIVAGGGGGAGSYSGTYRYSGGAGGGNDGIAGGQYSTTYRAGLGGSSTSSGISFYGTNQNSTSYGTPASFGLGGAAGSSTYVAGGGGGWYGGGYARRASGGGGSGWVYTEANEIYTDSSYIGGTWMLNSDYWLKEGARTVAGDYVGGFPNFEGTATEYGHSGDGAARISGTAETVVYEIPRVVSLNSEDLTPLSLLKGMEYDLLSDVRLEQAAGETNGKFVSVNVDGINVGASFILNTSTLGEGTFTINYIVQNEAGQQFSYKKKLSILSAQIIYESDAPGSNVDPYDEVDLAPGTYLLEVWGAQGGSYGGTYIGGKGGYSYGTLILDEPTTVYVYVGGQPALNENKKTVVAGGFNGGGDGVNRDYDVETYGQGGGGATDIRIDSVNLYARVIVAGGGSGSTNRTSGYFGGGITGGYGKNGYQGTQTTSGNRGSFGIGGAAAYTNRFYYNYGSAGGGGGWYGGGASSSYSDTINYDTYSGGGSGYVYTSTSYKPSGYLLDSKYQLDRDGNEAGTIAGNQEFKDYNGLTVTGNSGNGAARIARIG